MNATPPAPPYGVIGLGQVGSAITRALSRSFPEVPVLAVEPDPKARAQALQNRVVTEALDQPGPALQACGLIFLCVPLGRLRGVLDGLAPFLGAEVLLSDTIMVKGAVEELVAEVLPEAIFVGGHPMVGGDGTDPGGRADLFAGKTVVLTPRPGQEPHAARLGTVWAAMGARPVVLSAQEHDRLVAATTHAPYLAALALTRVAGSLEGAERVVGKSFADVSRLASLAPEVAAASVGANPFAAAAARVLADELHRLADLAEREPGALAELAAEGRSLRAKLLPDSGQSITAPR